MNAYPQTGESTCEIGHEIVSWTTWVSSRHRDTIQLLAVSIHTRLVQSIIVTSTRINSRASVTEHEQQTGCRLAVNSTSEVF